MNVLNKKIKNCKQIHKKVIKKSYHDQIKIVFNRKTAK